MLLEYDDMANEQRQIIYSQRNTILEADVITDLLDSMRENVIETEILNFKDENAPLSNWNLDGIENSLANIFGHNFLIRDWLKQDKNLMKKL